MQDVERDLQSKRDNTIFDQPALDALSACKIVFCDSNYALEKLMEKGLAQSAIVKTSSPFILAQDRPTVQRLDDVWTPDSLEAYRIQYDLLLEKIYIELSFALPNSLDLVACVTQCVSRFKNNFFKLACLDESDLDSQVLVVEVNKKGWNPTINPDWTPLLQVNRSATRVTIDVPNTSTKRNKTGLITRLSFGGWRTVVFRLAQFLFRHKLLPQKTDRLLVFGENELLIDVVADLVLGGASIDMGSRKTSRRQADNIASQKNEYGFVTEKVVRLYEDFAVRYLHQRILPASSEALVELVSESIRQFELIKHRAAQSLPRITEHLENGGRYFAFLNSASSKFLAEAAVLRSRGVIVIGVQHAATIEFSARFSESLPFIDEVASDIVLAFNNKLAQRLEGICFARARHLTVGLSHRHQRIRKSSGVSVQLLYPRVCYVSTNLLRGNVGGFVCTLSDWEKVQCEIKFARDVLSRAPSRIDFKGYPVETSRYTDPNPIYEAVRAISNINLIETSIDMRYLVNKYDLFITSCATSTATWLMLSDKPLIFLDKKNDSPLHHEAVEAFKTGLFYVDVSEPEYEIKITYYLHLTRSEVEEEWSKKSKARERLLEEYVGQQPKRLILQDIIELSRSIPT